MEKRIALQRRHFNAESARGNGDNTTKLVHSAQSQGYHYDEYPVGSHPHEDFYRERKHFPAVANFTSGHEYHWWDNPKRRLHYEYAEPRISSVRCVQPTKPFEAGRVYTEQRRHFDGILAQTLAYKDFDGIGRLKRVDTQLKDPSVIFQSVSDEIKRKEEVLLRRTMTRKYQVPGELVRNLISVTHEGDKPYGYVDYSPDFFGCMYGDEKQRKWNGSTHTSKEPPKRVKIDKRKFKGPIVKISEAEARPKSADDVSLIPLRLSVGTETKEAEAKPRVQLKMRTYKEVVRERELLEDIRSVEKLPETGVEEHEGEVTNIAPPPQKKETVQKGKK